jgi:hypothetical protein
MFSFKILKVGHHGVTLFHSYGCTGKLQEENKHLKAFPRPNKKMKACFKGLFLRKARRNQMRS